MDAPLKFGVQGGAQLESSGADETFSVAEVIEQLSGFVRRQFPIFIFVTACCVALGIVYLFTTSPTFTSHAMLLIDSSKLRILQQQTTPIGDVPIDTAQVETQVEILKSENIGLSVIKDLKLTEDPEFSGHRWGLIGWAISFFSPAEQQSETALTRRALATFLNKRKVSRVGLTYVLDIGFTSLNAARSAAIANAIADAYVVDQLEAKYQTTRRASVWMQDRIRELRQQASHADRAVLDYKEKNNIVSIAGTPTSGPRLLGEQQIEELNTQLGKARASEDEAKARLDRINNVMSKDVPDATVADTLHSDVINRLRNNYLDIAAKEAIWSARYGNGHLAAVNLRTQMAELRRSILDELGRIAQGYKSDYEIAKSRVDALEKTLGGLVANSQVTNRDRLGLRDLESSAQVYHTLYDNFLQRYMEVIQQQSFPITESRVISAAAPPQQKSGPLAVPVLGIAFLVGVALSFGAAIIREAVDQVFRTTREIEGALVTHCLAVLPKLAHGNRAIDKDSKKSVFASRGVSERPIPSESLRLARTPISIKKEFMRQVIDEPLSAFAEAFRSIKIAADLSGARKNGKVIGITSTVAGEGKSTVSSNLAQLIAHAGWRVILLDGDLRNPSITRSLAPDAKTGMLEVLDNKVSLNDALRADAETGLDFLPTVMTQRLAHTSEVLASDLLRRLVERLCTSYDYVIVDFPPLAPVVDVRATAQLIDSFIYVVEWGKTPKNLVKRQLQTVPQIHERLLGVVLNKADVDVLARYETYHGRNYYKKYYGSQYTYSG